MTASVQTDHAFLHFILISHQPIDRYDSYNSVTLRQANLPGGKPACIRFP